MHCRQSKVAIFNVDVEKVGVTPFAKSVFSIFFINVSNPVNRILVDVIQQGKRKVIGYKRNLWDAGKITQQNLQFFPIL